MKKSLILGERNTAAIAAGVSAQPITITYNFGGIFTFTKFCMFYVPVIDFMLIRLVDTMHNRDIISGNTVIASVGAPVAPSLARFMPWIDIEPVQVANGQSIQLFVNNITAVACPANQLSLSLYGYVD